MDVYRVLGMIPTKKGYLIEQFKQFPITYTLILINIVVFILPLFGGVNIVNISSEELYNLGAIFGPSVVLDKEIWRIFVSMFLHGGAEHIVMNMISLFLVGRSVEMIFSKSAYLGIYLMSGLLGGLFSIYFHPVTVAIGASGAIFGIFGAMVGFVLVNRQRMQQQFMAFIRSIGLVLLLNLVIGLAIPSIDLSAHIAGLTVGFIGGMAVGKSQNFLWMYMILMVFVMWGVYAYLPTLYVNPNLGIF
jgi:rhomboid protease GluP